MTTADLYQQLNQNIPRLQSFACELTKDFDTARLLYLETAHQAIKNNVSLEPDTFEDWLINTMKNSYRKMAKRGATIAGH